MTDFGVRAAAGGSTEAKQDDQETSLDAIQSAVEALTLDTKITPVEAEVFNNLQSEYTSDPIISKGYRSFLLRIILTFAGTPTNIKINVQFSQAGITFENYVRGPFGSLMYVYEAGAKSECINGPMMGDQMKINVKATGVDAGSTFTLTCKLHGFR